MVNIGSYHPKLAEPCGKTLMWHPDSLRNVASSGALANPTGPKLETAGSQQGSGDAQLGKPISHRAATRHDPSHWKREKLELPKGPKTVLKFTDTA